MSYSPEMKLPTGTGGIAQWKSICPARVRPWAQQKYILGFRELNCRWVSLLPQGGWGKESKNKVTLNIKRTHDSNIFSRATNTKVAEYSLGKYNLRDLTI